MSDKYALIAAEQAMSGPAPSVSAMCAGLEVSRSGFYDWQRADGTYGKQFVTDTYLLPERQLILASYRLAAVLNDLFG